MAPPSEAGFDAAVVEAATTLFGYRVFHVRDSRGTPAGFPDRLFLRPVGNPADDVWAIRLVAELKRKGEKPTRAQAWWLQVWEATGVPAYWWTPDHWDELLEALRAHL